jgi:asparagine synthase (glutamine-hydrolysing)
VLDEFVLGSRAQERGIFNTDLVRSLVEQHRRGEANHSERLWSLVNLEMWFRRFIDGENTNSQCENADESMLATTRA